MQPVPNPKVEPLVRAAHEAMRARRQEEAVRLWDQVLVAAPDHPQALFHLGSYALFRKEPARARDLFELALKSDPSGAAIALNLSYAYRALGDADKEMAAITRALTIDPHFFPALLAKGVISERVAGAKAATKTYKSAIAIAPPEEELAPDMRQALQHARDVVAENAVAMEKFLDGRLAGIRALHAGANLDRFEECKDIALGTKKAFTQKPAMLLVPELPPIQFYDRAGFAWLPALEAATDVIREELSVVIRAQSEDFKPYVNRPAGMPLDEWKELNQSLRWSSYFFWRDGKRFDEAHARCPRTSAALDAVPLMYAENFGPTVMFSVLAPHTHLPAHTSATNARLIVHLPLIVPGNCRFRVGNHTRDFQEGNGWVFDDTIEHEAWNDSDEYRTILILDVWNPYLTMAERDLVVALLNGMNEFYGG